jgi:hypothetical protein
LWVLQDKHYELSVLFWLCTSHIDHDMFLLSFDGKNDRCRIVVPFWDTFNIDFDCSVIRLSCLDELMNNDILLSLSFA